MIGTVVFSVLFGMTLVSTLTADELTPLHIILPPLFAVLTAVSVWLVLKRAKR